MCLVDVLLFGGEHMSTAAVPPWIGSDCVLANCIPGSQAKSEWSELSHFWYQRSTWFTCLFFHRIVAAIHLGQNSTWLGRSNFSQTKDAEEVIVRHFRWSVRRHVMWAAVLLYPPSDTVCKSCSTASSCMNVVVMMYEGGLICARWSGEAISVQHGWNYRIETAVATFLVMKRNCWEEKYLFPHNRNP